MIRKAVLSDFDNICRLLVMMHKESRYREFNVNEEKGGGFVKSMISNNIAIISEDDGEINGVLFAIMSEMYFSDAIVASDRIIYVRPEYRMKGIGSKLVDEYIQAAKDGGADDILLSTSTGITSTAMGKISKTYSMTKVGESYKLKV